MAKEFKVEIVYPANKEGVACININGTNYLYKFPNGPDQYWSYYYSYHYNRGIFINKIKQFRTEESNGTNGS